MIYAIIALSLLTPLLVIVAYRQGIKDGRAIISNEPLQPLVEPPRVSHDDIEDKRYSQILSNIDNYTGDSAGQKKVSK